MRTSCAQLLVCVFGLIPAFALAEDVKVTDWRGETVMASEGSVVPYFKELLDQGGDRLPVTDRRMTRFMLTLEDSVDLVLRAFASCEDGETFILDLPAFD